MEYFRVKITHSTQNYFFVSSTNGYRLVNLDPFYCSCPDFVSRVLLQKKKKACKHVKFIIDEKKRTKKEKERVIEFLADDFTNLLLSTSFLEEGIIFYEKEEEGDITN